LFRQLKPGSREILWKKGRCLLSLRTVDLAQLGEASGEQDMSSRV